MVQGYRSDGHKDLKIKFRGSSNQRIIDLKLSRKENKVILKEDLMYR